MNFFSRVVVSFIAVWCAGVLYAGSDPVAWSLFPTSGFANTPIGHQSVVQYTLTNRLPFAALIVTEYKVTGGNFNVHDECDGNSLAPNASCQISVAFNPASDQTSTFQLIYGYHNNRIPLPILSAVGTGEPTNIALHGAIRDLPPTIYKGNTVDFYAVFTNTSDTDLTGCTAAPLFTSTGVAATLGSSQGTPPCTGTIAAHASCEWDGTVDSNTAGLLTIFAAVTCTGPTAVTTNPRASTIVQDETSCLVQAQVELPLPESTYQYADNIVKFKFKNQCATPVSLSGMQVVAEGVTAQVTTSSSLSTCGSSLAEMQSATWCLR